MYTSNLAQCCNCCKYFLLHHLGSCLTSLYVMAFTSGLTGAGSDSTYQIRLQYGGSTRTLSFYDRPGDDLQSNKGDLWQFSLSGCITLSALSSVSIVAAGTDGWNIGSVVTLVGDSVGRIQVLTRNFNANFWIDTDSGFDRPFVLSLSLSGVNLGMFILDVTLQKRMSELHPKIGVK